MSRDQRVRDNHGLLEAQALGNDVRVVFCLLERCGEATLRSFEFMLTGLEEVERDLAALGIPFDLLLGAPEQALRGYLDEQRATALVCDFSPLHPSRRKRERLASELDIPLIEVDSRNIVPAWKAADKHVYAAHNLRRRHAKLLPEYLTEIPAPKRGGPAIRPGIDWSAARAYVGADDIGPALSTPSGESAALDALDAFVSDRLPGYAELRGAPDHDHQSRLSPYLHFGQLSAQRAVLTVRASSAGSDDIESFVDEAVTWRELSDNYCMNVPDYRTPEGFADWARQTLSAHEADPREVIYDLEAFETADTHDVLWNAAQLEMVRTGRMHNYMRMYWAKKILEWSESPADAMRIAGVLNDRYELDGRDTNGYAGIAWSIGGVHDRPWQERSVYGKIRYMNDNGARRKFDVDAYIRRVAPELLDAQLF